MRWDFSLLLFILLLITGAIWLWDRFSLAAKRKQQVEAAVAAVPVVPGLTSAQQQELKEEARAQAAKMSWWVEYGVSFFPVILFVFILRSFIFEPFRIPSGSMLPTLKSGDFILVNKFQYGIRLPIINKKLIPIQNPKVGDALVFKYPVEPSIDYIKRVVGLPGQTVRYEGNQLYIDGKQVPITPHGQYFEPDRNNYVSEFTESLGANTNQILLNMQEEQVFMPITRFPYIENCTYRRHAVECLVPEGNYFVMGDNRDNSLDSRYWGFVPDENIVGRAFFIWMNFSEPGRIGRFN